MTNPPGERRGVSSGVRLPLKSTRIDDLDLADARTAYLLDARGRLWRTSDLGRSWRHLRGLGSEVAYAVHFANRRQGWVAVTELGDARGGWVLRTDDGGRSWTPQRVARRRLGRAGLAVTSPSRALALAGNHLFATRNAGVLGRRARLSITSPTRRVGRAGDAVRILGRLTPARGGERVVVSLLERGTSRWRFQDAVAASDGRFTVVVRVRRGATVVAQWGGNGRLNGDGTPPRRIGGPSTS